MIYNILPRVSEWINMVMPTTDVTMKGTKAILAEDDNLVGCSGLTQVNHGI